MKTAPFIKSIRSESILDLRAYTAEIAKMAYLEGEEEGRKEKEIGHNYPFPVNNSY